MFFVKKKWSVTEDGHTMGMEGGDAFKTMAEFVVDENIEKDLSIERVLFDSGKTKKKMSQRRSSDNRKKRSKEKLKMSRHNGPVKFYSREEILRFESMRAG